MWFSHNGERLGTYEGNNGTVWTVDVDRALVFSSSLMVFYWPWILNAVAQSKFLVSGAADNTLRLWSVSTGKCLYTWEFPTAVKRVAFNEKGTQVVCITEQRMGHQCAIRVFEINSDGDGTKRMSSRGYLMPFPFSIVFLSQNQKNLYTCSTLSAQKRLSAHSHWHQMLLSPDTNQARSLFLTSRPGKRLTATSGHIAMWLLIYRWARTGRIA